MTGECARWSAGGRPRSLADIVADYMERESLTLQAMARKSGLSVASIAALRSGSRGKRPQPHTVTKLAAAMGYDADELATVVDATADDRRREQLVVRRFRELGEEDKRQVERLVERLHRNGLQS